MWEFDFQPYLSAIVAHYTKACDFYTPTDAVLPLQARSVGREQDDREQKVEPFPVLAGLKRYALGEEREHVLLAGRPGSGKSTALRQWVGDLVAAGLVPVLVQLKGDRTVPELIKAEFRRFKIRVTDEQIDDWLLADQLVLLLDGVNEIPTEDLRRELQRFREENRSVPMVFTTRDLSLGGDLGIEKRFKMQPLSDRQMRDFVEKYLPEQGNRLLGQLRDRLREIAETPLLLKMLCDVFKQTEQIPQNKGELFRWFDREYDRFKGLPAVSAEFRRFKSEVLQYLAFAMMQGDSRTEFWLTIDRGRAESLIEEWLTGRVSDPAEKAKEWLEDLLEHHLLQVAADGRRVEFHHQLFLEYYAAEHFWQALERHSNWLEKQEGEEFSWFQQHYLNNLKWTEPISLMLGLPEVDRRSAVEIVEQALAIDLILGAKLAGAVIEEIQKMLMPRLLNLPLSDVIKLELLRATKSLLAIEFILQIFRKSPAKLSQLTASILRDLNAEKQCDYHKDLKTALDSIDFWNQFLGCDWSENDRKRIEEDFWEGVYYICIESDEFDLNEDIHIFASNLCDSKRDWRDLRVTIQNGIYHSNPRIRSIAIEAAGIFYLEEAQTFSPDMLQTPVSEVHQTSIRAAEKDDFTNIVDCLLNQWEIEQNDQVKTVLENVLSNLNQPVYLKFLYNSWTQNDSWQFFHAFQTIQESCKFYNYEIYQKALARSALDTQQFSPANTIHFAGDYIAGDKVGRDKILGDKNEAPNASEVKIFEQIDNYHESPRDPPS